jgi:tetratricopeptide (TPR) repeat protein
MGERQPESAVERLRKQAEHAIAAAQGRRTVEPLLERLLHLAPDGSEPSVFAHRHLAEFRIEDHPWRALLHLRKVVTASPDDDVVHALMGLSQALLANFKAAVASYRRALAIAPRNPWYHHNLGHLLDVALDQPGAAVRHLEIAHRATHPVEHEIGASLAHCLARLGRLDEARSIASAVASAEPRNREHKNLLAWIERGAPRDGDEPRATREKSEGSAPSRPESRPLEHRPLENGLANKRAPSRPPPPSELHGSRGLRALVGSTAQSVGRSAAGGGADSPPSQLERKEGSLPSGAGRRAAARDPSPESSALAHRAEAAGRGSRPPRGAAERPSANAEARDPSDAHDVGLEDGGVTDPSALETSDLDEVSSIVERIMREGGFTPEHVARARRLWVDYREQRSLREDRALRSQKPGVCAAAVEYAIARLHGLDGVTRASVARRYGVSSSSVGERFDDIQVVLMLKPDDPRYARC